MSDTSCSGKGNIWLSRTLALAIMYPGLVALTCNHPVPWAGGPYIPFRTLGWWPSHTIMYPGLVALTYHHVPWAGGPYRLNGCRRQWQQTFPNLQYVSGRSTAGENIQPRGVLTRGCTNQGCVLTRGCTNQGVC